MIDTTSIFDIKTEEQFNAIALEVFKYQFEHNKVYRSFCDLLYKHPSEVKTIKEIPFLPIQFFKTHEVITSKEKPVQIFESSGTTGSINSKHYITDLSLYEASFRAGFKHFYGDVEDYTILALLPSYLKRNNSSLVYMVNDLIVNSKNPDSGFYLNNLSNLKDTLLRLEKQGQKTLLIGVSFALLDLIELHKFNLKNTIIMETGGMKGKRKEMIKSELHKTLIDGFGVLSIHSEYGMTELLSQGYSTGNGIFKTVPWMKVLTRSITDSLEILENGKSGAINIIDLANINSCSFIATQDLGKIHRNNSFEILGRFDAADIRGCNLMVL